MHNTVKVLDDFLFIGQSKEECERGLNSFISLCHLLNVPLAEEKTVHPCKSLTFLGFLLNTDKNTIGLTVEKVSQYSTCLEGTLHKKYISLRDLKSLLGKLQFCATIVPGGRSFLRRLYDRTIGIRKPYGRIRITKAMLDDLHMWNTFLNTFDGVEIIRHLNLDKRPTKHMITDSSKDGYGGIFGNHFIMGKFPRPWKNLNIMTLEFYPIYALLCTFAHELRHHKLVIHSDNKPLVQAINKQTCRRLKVMKLMRPFVLLLLKHRIVCEAFHVPGS